MLGVNVLANVGVEYLIGHTPFVLAVTAVKQVLLAQVETIGAVEVADRPADRLGDDVEGLPGFHSG